jgi:hypothetical protein
MTKYIFLDTNIYLHYKPVEQLSLERFGTDCTLVVPRVILGELNKHKDTHSSQNIRNRARSVCKIINQWSVAKSVSGVFGFEFGIKTSSPQDHGLDSSSCDDRFLSDILEHPAALADKLLITNDSNLCLTAKHLGITVEELDDQFKLPIEPDPLEQENARLRRELDQLKNARPQLKIGLISDKSNLEVDANPVFLLEPDKTELTNEEIDRQVEEIRRSLGGKYITPQQDHNSPMALLEIMRVSTEDISKYHRRLDEYPAVYRKYLLKLREFKCKPKCKFTIGIYNSGTAPAQNVDIYLHFPDGFELFEEEDVPHEPREPELPQKPEPMSELIRQSLHSNFHNVGRFMAPNIKSPSSFSMKRTKSYDLSDSFHVIKHNERECLPELFLVFNSVETAKSFRCEYRVTVANLPEEIKGNINFQFQADREPTID